MRDEELSALEQKYGGGIVRVRRRKISKADPRISEQRIPGSMMSGARMEYKGYGGHYAREMNEMIEVETLRQMELKFSGGGRSRVAWPNTSPHDPRSQEEIDAGGHDGHRMQPRGPKGIGGRDYAAAYSSELKWQPSVLVELGVLRGVGLAIWCDIFPEARVIGLDIDVGNFWSNVRTLRERGAFQHNFPEVYPFDELASHPIKRISGILRRDKIDIMIDDALHIEGPILGAMEAFMPHMAQNFLYFVEDHSTVHKKIKDRYPELSVRAYRELTVVKPA